MSKTYCKGILVNDETREYSGCAGGEDCPVCKGKPFHHDDKCRYWDEGEFCDCGVWDLRYQQIAYESVIDRLTAELAEANKELTTANQVALELDDALESSERELERYKRISESGESLGGELEERERRMELQSRLARYEEGVEVTGKVEFYEAHWGGEVNRIRFIDVSNTDLKIGQPVTVNVRTRGKE